MNLDDAKFLQSLGDRIRERRLSRNLTQGQLAELCELHRTFIGSVERGERNVSILNLRLIARVLRISLSDMLADPAGNRRPGWGVKSLEILARFDNKRQLVCLLDPDGMREATSTNLGRPRPPFRSGPGHVPFSGSMLETLDATALAEEVLLAFFAADPHGEIRFLGAAR
jgi:transcriptional regulator with XRE-family HTH domain